MPMPVIILTDLNNLTPNLEVGQVADPELRQIVFEQIYTYLQGIVTSINTEYVTAAVVDTKINNTVKTTTIQVVDDFPVGPFTAGQIIYHRVLKGLYVYDTTNGWIQSTNTVDIEIQALYAR